MKKILALILSVSLIFITLAVSGVIASAEGVTVGDTSVWAYTGTAKGTAASADTIIYKSDVTDAESNQYATASEAFVAAINLVMSDTTQTLYLNQDFALETPATVEVNKTININMCGFTLSYNPSEEALAENPDKIGIYISAAGNGTLKFTTGAAAGDAQTFAGYENGPLFKPTVQNTKAITIIGIANGDFVTGKCCGLLSNATLYGNYISDFTAGDVTRFSNSTVYESIITDTVQFFQIGGTVNVKGDFISTVGKLQNQGTLNILGNAEFSNQYGNSSNKPAIENQYGKAISIGGDLTVHGKKEAYPVLTITKSFTVGGKTVVDGVSTDFTVVNSTFTKGFDNQTSAAVTFDGTDKFGSEFVGENGESSIVLTAYGESITPPDGTWLDSKGNKIDFTSLTQGTEFNTYYAKVNPLLVSVEMIKGAAIRLGEVNGIRFLTKFDTEKINTLTQQGAVFEYGTLIAPKDLIEGANLTFDLDNSKYINVKYTSDKWHKEDGQIAGSIIGIKESNTDWSTETGNLTRSFIGRGYVKVTLNGESHINYASYANNDIDNNTRSLKSVALAIQADTAAYNSYSDAIRARIDYWAAAQRNAQEPEPTAATTAATEPTTAAEITADGMRIEKFSYTCMNPNNEGTTMTDYSYTIFPKSYSESGTPLRMVIDCHGFGDSPTPEKISQNFMWDVFLAHQGYLVLIPNGAGYNNLGCPASINSYVQAYNYALAHYNVKDDGVFVNGNSMGGLTSINLVCSGRIPVLAHSLHYGVTSHRRQIYDNTWASRNANDSAYFYYFKYDKYNEAHGTDYKFTTFPFANSSTKASEDELELYNYNFADKIATQDSIWRYCSSFFDYSTKTFKEGYEDFISTTDEARVAELYDKVSIDYPVPVLAQHGLTDGSVKCQFTKYFVNAVNRGSGKTAQGIYYNTSVHGVCIGDKATYTCNDGAEYTIAQSGYEMYQFFKANDK